MDIFDVLTMLGGLCLFLYGMNVMSGGLQKVSGGRLERILERLTSNPLKAVCLGAAVTAVIQSSSATTVMVVGFVNSGIMQLSQAIGLIMGANVGTTITAWLLSLTGIEGSNIFIQMLKPSSFSPILALIGIILFLAGKKSYKKDIGEILLGFAVLMFGMETMSDAVEPLADSPAFTSILTIFDNPFFGILVGALLTAVIQSSSASVGILQALSATGAFTYGSVIPIIMGQNIGTCVTAMISCIGGNRSAKRTAIVHLYFNIIGTIIFLSLYYILNAIFHFAFVDDTVGAAGIAVIHSVFNLFTTAILLPFTKGLEKLAYLTLPRTEEEKAEQEKANRFKMLSDKYLNNPGFALVQAQDLTVEMADLTRRSVDKATGLIFTYTPEEFGELSDLEESADYYEDKLTNFLSKLSGQNVSYRDGQRISVLQHSITDFERISDLAIGIGKLAREKSEKGYSFSKKGESELGIYCDAVNDIVGRTVRAFSENDIELAHTVEPLQTVIGGLNKRSNKNHMKRLRNGKCTVEVGLALADICGYLNRISGHCSNIAIYELQLHDSSIREHAYLEQLDEEENEQFIEQVKEFREKYHF